MAKNNNPEQLRDEIEVSSKVGRDGKSRVFFRNRDTEKISAFLAGAPNLDTRNALKSMIQATCFGATCVLGRIRVYPNHWKNGFFIEVSQR